MATAGWYVKMRIGAPGLAIEPRQPVMAIRASLFAIVAADAQIFVDQQHICRFADTVLDKERRNRAVHIDNARKTVLLRFDEIVDVFARFHFAPRLRQ